MIGTDINNRIHLRCMVPVVLCAFLNRVFTLRNADLIKYETKPDRFDNSSFGFIKS